MALGSTIYKAEVDISDLDRNYYANHSLTVARHPSETEGRLMLRLLSFCLWGSPTLRFVDGLSKEGEPALRDTDDTGWTTLWIELGTPPVKQIRKAAGHSSHVVVVAYGDDRIPVWWDSHRGDIGKVSKAEVLAIHDEQFESLANLCDRHMRLAVTIQDKVIWIADGKDRNIEIHLETMKTATT